MLTLKIDADSPGIVVLSGDIKTLLKSRRISLYLTSNYKIVSTSEISLVIEVPISEYQHKLEEIDRAFKRFGIVIEYSDSVDAEFNSFKEEADKFDLFSTSALNIRDNELNDQHIEDFREFTEMLEVGMKNRRLYELQLLSAYHLAFSMNSCNFSVPGAGKTSIVYGAYTYLKNLPKTNPRQIERIIIVGPLSSFGPWEDEYFECFGKKPTVKRVSGELPRTERINYLTDIETCEITLISYVTAAMLVPEIELFMQRFNTMLVLDEAHKIKNTEGGFIASNILKLAPLAKSRVILTGTPAPNGYQDLHNLFEFIWPRKRVLGYHINQLKVMTENGADTRVSRLIDNISPFFIRIRKSQLGIPEALIHEPINVPMGPIQSRIYAYIEQSTMDYMQNERIDSFSDKLAKARMIRLLQASTNPTLLQNPLDEHYANLGLQGFDLIDDSEIIKDIQTYSLNEVPAKFIEAGKLVSEILKDLNERVIIWAIFIKNIEDLQSYLGSIGIISETLYGATPIESDEDDPTIMTRERIIRAFHKPDSKFKVIIANPFAVSESISLHKVCHHAIYLERSFNAAHYVQSKDRIHRYGLKPGDSTNYYHLLSENNIDLTVHQRLREKEERMNLIMERDDIPLFDLALNVDADNDLQTLIKNYTNGISRT
jgi:SNF2 family DNA or RNA helicase